MGYPGPQKQKVEYFIHRLYERKHGPLAWKEIMPEVERFSFAPDVQVFFKELPKDRKYDESGLIEALNDVISSRGRDQAIGGRIEHIDEIPAEWERAYGKAQEKPTRH